MGNGAKVSQNASLGSFSTVVFVLSVLIKAIGEGINKCGSSRIREGVDRRSLLQISLRTNGVVDVELAECAHGFHTVFGQK